MDVFMFDVVSSKKSQSQSDKKTKKSSSILWLNSSMMSFLVTRSSLRRCRVMKTILANIEMVNNNLIAVIQTRFL